MLIGICIIPMGILSAMLTNRGVGPLWALYAPIAGGVVIYLAMRWYFAPKDCPTGKESSRHTIVTTDTNQAPSYGSFVAVHTASACHQLQLIVPRGSRFDRFSESVHYSSNSMASRSEVVIVSENAPPSRRGNTASSHDLVGV